MILMKFFFGQLVVFLSSKSFFALDLNLPEQHIDYYFNSFPAEREKCREDPKCPYKEHLERKSCWGYELECKQENSYSIPRCPGDHKGWVSTKKDQLDTFYAQGDFGYIKKQRSEMKIYCKPLYKDDSSLECSDHLRFCRGRNIMLNFTQLIHRNEPLRYKMDVLNKGDIGGYCTFDKNIMEENTDHVSPLQSWGPELRNFKNLSRRPIVNGDCEVVIEKPTYVMKIDATVNFYHHFCDFLNLYASLHVNLSHPSGFDTDNHILIWETYSYRSAFQDTFEAFTTNQLWDLKTFRGKTVCFKNIVFPLLPRMIFGLYYNTPLAYFPMPLRQIMCLTDQYPKIYGCESSGLFKAFKDHILHRLNIPLYQRDNSKIRVTLLSRDTQYRKILNEDELIEKLDEDSNYVVRKVVFNKHVPFKKQLEISRNTDILIGIHGAGLTHLLFLPDWAAVFEIYNCEDAGCYKDLARLRGVKYVTWENINLLHQQDLGNHPNGGAHAKFTNYSFNVKEFLRIVALAGKHVKNHKSFQEFTKTKRISKKDEL